MTTVRLDTSDNHTGAVSSEVVVATTPTISQRGAITLDHSSLYTESDGEERKVFRLLDECIEHLDRALRETDIARDLNCQYISSVLVELFCFRTRSDGFGMIIVSLHNAIRYRVGFLADNQIIAVSAAIRSLRRNPWPLDGIAIEIIRNLEIADLTITAPEFREAVLSLSMENENESDKTSMEAQTVQDDLST